MRHPSGLVNLVVDEPKGGPTRGRVTGLAEHRPDGASVAAGLTAGRPAAHVDTQPSTVPTPSDGSPDRRDSKTMSRMLTAAKTTQELGCQAAGFWTRCDRAVAS